MNEEEFQKYIKERYNDQIDWYEKKSAKNKRFYIILQWIVIALAASVPVLVVVASKAYEWITIVASIILAIGTAGIKTFKFQENWINYRTIAETLKKEKYFYDADLDDYSETPDKEALFVERVESIISRENTLWITTHMHKKEDKKTPQK